MAAQAYTYEQLKKMTVAELREIAKGLQHEKLQGHTQMNKEHLLPALCEALHIRHNHQVDGQFDKLAVKSRLRALKRERDAALEAHDPARLQDVRRQIHSLNHRIRTHVH